MDEVFPLKPNLFSQVYRSMFASLLYAARESYQMPGKLLLELLESVYKTMTRETLYHLLQFRMPVVDFPCIEKFDKERLIKALLAVADVPFCAISRMWLTKEPSDDPVDDANLAAHRLVVELGMDGDASAADAIAFIKDKARRCPDMVVVKARALQDDEDDETVAEFNRAFLIRGHLFSHRTLPEGYVVGTDHRFVKFPVGSMQFYGE